MEIKTSILDNDKELLNNMEEWLKIYGVNNLECYTNNTDYLESLEEPAICVIDYYLDECKTAVDIMKEVIKKDILCQFIVISNLGSLPMVLDIVNLKSGFAFLRKNEDDFLEKLYNEVVRAREILAVKVEAENRRRNTVAEVKNLLKKASGMTAKVFTPYIVDDDQFIMDEIGHALEEAGIYNVQIEHDYNKFLNALNADLIIAVIDHSFPGGITGLDIVKEIREKNKYSVVIVCSGQRDHNVTKKYIKAKVDDYVDKNDKDYEQQLITGLKNGISEAQERLQVIKALQKHVEQLQ